MKELVVKIKDGKVSIDVLGVVGAACDSLAQKLSDALGTVVQQTQKPEHHVELDDMTLKQFITEE